MSSGHLSKAAPEGAAQSVRCLAIPLVGAKLLLPHTAVAEVAGYQPPVPVPNAPRWLLGLMQWRGTTVPLVALERLLGQLPDPAERPERVVVFNTLNGEPRLPFVAIPVDGLPRLTLASADSIETLPGQPDDGTLVMRRAQTGGDSFIIPDFDMLEAMLLRLGISSFSGTATQS